MPVEHGSVAADSTRHGPEPAAAGQVHKVIRLVATSPISWEDATRRGVGEAARSIVDLRRARVAEQDTLLDAAGVRHYRVKLEMVFRVDRTRRLPGTSEAVEVRRHLVVANETLISHALHELVQARAVAAPSEFHILAPCPRRHRGEAHERDLQEAARRVEAFEFAFSHLPHSLTGEVGTGDPVAAARRVMERASFDEIIVSTLPPERSHWLRRDLPRRLERAFSIPVTSLVHDEGADITTCPIG